MNFIHEKLPDSDRELFFGPLDESEKFILINNQTMIEHLLIMVGKFSSLSQSRKNGFSGPLKKGFQEIKIGKTRISVLNDFTSDF